jgi:hypothetical protein
MSKTRLWIGRIMVAIAVLFMIFDGVLHIMNPQAVVDGFISLGYSDSLAIPLGIIELICLLFYIIPRTRVFGAILLTGYLGGAVASNVRIGSPFFSNILFPVYIAILLWGGLYLLDTKIGGILFSRKTHE